MKVLTKREFLCEIEDVWCDDITGVVTMIRYLNHHINEDDEDVDEEEFYNEHIDYYDDGVTKYTLQCLVEEWDMGWCTIKTIVEFLDNYVMSWYFLHKIKR